MTDIEIVNVALGLLGKKGIISFEDNSDTARLAKSLYSGTRDKVLEARLWTFATKRFALAPLAAAPVFGYEKQFEIPSEVVRVHRVVDGAGESIDWKLEGRRILADVTEIYVIAVTKITDTSLYSPGFCSALSYKLAERMAVPLVTNRQLMADMKAGYDEEIKEAGGTDGSQGKNERTTASWVQQARR